MIKKLIGIFIIFSTVFHVCRAQHTEELSRALYLINIAEHTKLPNSPENAYTITIVGQSKVYNELLSHMQRRQVNGVSFKLLQVDNIDMLKPSQIVFFSADKSHQIKNFSNRTSHQSFMIIGEQEGTYKNGADFSFVMEEGKLKMDVNRGSLQTKNITLSRTLAGILHKNVSASNRR